MLKKHIVAILIAVWCVPIFAHPGKTDRISSQSSAAIKQAGSSLAENSDLVAYRDDDVIKKILRDQDRNRSFTTREIACTRFFVLGHLVLQLGDDCDGGAGGGVGGGGGGAF